MPGQDDRRNAPRVPANLRVDYKYGATTGRARTVDISQTGLFIKTKELASVGDSVYLNLYLDGGEILKVFGTVRRVVAVGGSDSAGMGVQFSVLYGRDRSVMARFVQERMGRAEGDFEIDELVDGPFKLDLRETQRRSPAPFPDDQTLRNLDFQVKSNPLQPLLTLIWYGLAAAGCYWLFNAFRDYLATLPR